MLNIFLSGLLQFEKKLCITSDPYLTEEQALQLDNIDHYQI